MIHEQQHAISTLSNVREWTHVLLVNTPCSQLHSFCATGVHSSLATNVTLTRESRGRLAESITRRWTCFWFHFCTVVRDCCWVVYKMIHKYWLNREMSYCYTEVLAFSFFTRAGVAHYLDDRGSIPGRGRDFTCHHRVLPWGSPILPSNGYRGSFPGGNAAGAWF
jgi:hypothetical protein